MDADRLITAFIGAFLGAAGWLVVGLYMQRRQFDRQARNAARAVYFELAVNVVDINVALRHSTFGRLRRDSLPSSSRQSGAAISLTAARALAERR